jgi:two-component system, sensor histidine kinase
MTWKQTSTTDIGTGREGDRIKAQQVLAVSRNAITGAMSGILGGTILTVVLTTVQRTPAEWVLIWYATLFVTLSMQILVSVRYRRAPDSDYRPWAKGFTTLAVVSGLIWGFGVVGVSASGGIDTELLVLMVSSGIAAGSGLSNGSYLPTFYGRFLPTNLPYVAWSLWRADALHLSLALFTVVFMLGIMQLVRQYNNTIVEMIRLRFENVDLVEELRLQTDAANLANITKSRFLASASHDLRQPVHALSLFIGALRGSQMDPPARRLVSQIDKSVAALDNLFASLLDISKLDAGVVSLETRKFDIDPLLERVCGDHALEAQSKGVRLKMSPCSLTVNSDPILLERIVRNLVSNAVRYTTCGGIVVGCRRGHQLSIQIWDTGPGIAEEEQQNIFQEFYQIGNIERDRGAGLGLGLAIVKRLAELLDCKLTLKSKLGAGSVFQITVPLADGGPPGTKTVEDTVYRDTRGSLILVVDDESDIQDAMSSLLTSWGYEAIVAGSGDEMIREIINRPGRPNLIVCDYRLRNGEDGISVIRRLQSEYNEDIPAVLITGDTAPDRLKEALNSGLPLLHKPIHNDRLRSVIRDLLQQGATVSGV